MGNEVDNLTSILEAIYNFFRGLFSIIEFIFDFVKSCISFIGSAFDWITSFAGVLPASLGGIVFLVVCVALILLILNR